MGPFLFSSRLAARRHGGPHIDAPGPSVPGYSYARCLMLAKHNRERALVFRIAPRDRYYGGMPRRSHVIHTLLAFARQRAAFDEPRCRLVLDLIETTEALKNALRAHVGLPEGRFGALVTLFAAAPSPVSSAEIAEQTGISRSAITDVLDRLEADRLVARHRDTTDRRIIYVTITEAGQALIETAIGHFLDTAGRSASRVAPDRIENLLTVFAQLREGAVVVNQASPSTATLS